ncbi:MAG: DNA repair protein RecO (recombination protein O) [Arenicella sp.]|jgi:DNA repair protein RecO (recombination protein O)
MTGTLEGIVLQKTDYSETSLIIKLLTPEGVQSFIFQGAKRKGKKGNLISPLAILSIEYYKRNDSTLGKISKVEPSIIFKEIPFNPFKSSIVFFMNEVLNKTIKEKDVDHDLYTFVRSILEILDLTTHSANFPIKFLYELTKYMGFYPQVDEGGCFLDLQEGRYVRHQPNHPFYLSIEKSALLLQFSGMNFDGKDDPNVTLKDRRELVYDLLNYYKVIFENFEDIQSLSVLEATFHD